MLDFVSLFLVVGVPLISMRSSPNVCLSRAIADSLIRKVLQRVAKR